MEAKPAHPVEQNPPVVFFLLIHRCFNGGRYSPERLQGGTVIQCNGVGYTDEDLSEAAPFSPSQPSSPCIHTDQDGSVWF